MATAYWWTGRQNFGDMLTPLLLEHYANMQIYWNPLEQAEFISVGSILDVVPADWSGIVAGSGKLYENTAVSLPNAKILGVRGPLTARGIPGDFAVGDPGLLIDELVHVSKEYNLGIVPHWSDHELEHNPTFLQYDPLIIRVGDDPISVVESIAKCRKIVASSLHGIIVADAFGIPRRIEMCDRFAREGGDFKFRDHNAAVGLRHVIGKTQEAPRHRVQDRQSELFDMLEELRTFIR